MLALRTLFFEDLSVGMTERLSKTISSSDVVGFAAVTGDRNPIHLWPITARMFGFRKPIAHGWWVLGRALAEMDRDVPPRAVVEAKFLSPVELPSTVTLQSGRARAQGPGELARCFEVRGPTRGDRDPRCVVGTVRSLDG